MNKEKEILWGGEKKKKEKKKGSKKGEGGKKDKRSMEQEEKIEEEGELEFKKNSSEAFTAFSILNVKGGTTCQTIEDTLTQWMETKKFTFRFI